MDQCPRLAARIQFSECRSVFTRRSSALATWFSLLATLVIYGSAGSSAYGQPRVFSEADQQQMKEVQEAVKSGKMTQEEAMELMKSRFGGRRGRGGPPVASPGPAQQADAGEEKEDDEAKKDDKEEKKEGEDEAPTVKRSTDASAKGSADELKVRPDDKGMVQFSFHGQPWQDVLQWFSEIAKLSLDWTELPADQLNLTTRQPYTVAETRDVLNSRLLARGFTMIAKGDVLSVVKVDKLDPSLIPRVDPDDLEDYQPHDFVRVRFDIPRTMEPAKAQEDAKILLSPNAKATPLLASRRLLVIDAVANLRDVRDLLYGEQMAAEADIRPELFHIQYRRADYVADQVMVVMGMDPSSRKTPQELQIEQQRMQLMMQLAQQKKDVTKMLAPDGPPVFFAVDRHTNTIMVNAPPPEMDVIKRSIKMFDVPYGGGMASNDDGGGPLEFREYKTESASTDAVVTALKEIGSLHPLTQLQSDDRSDTIFATATPKDHEQIEALIKKLDGEGRRLYTLQLSRRYRAIEVAGTVTTLMVGEKKEEGNSRNRYYGGYYGGYGRGGNDDDDKEEIRIQPDVERNRLLLWATPEEYQEVVSLLQSLGAISNPSVAGSGVGDNLRVLQQRTPEETARLLERLKQALGDDVEIVAPKAEETPKSDAKPSEDSGSAEKDDQITHIDLRPFIQGQRKTWLAQAGESTAAGSEAEDASESSAQPDSSNEKRGGETGASGAAEGESSGADPAASPSPKPRPKVKIIVTDDGRILLNSEDPVALDRIEALIEEIEPPRNDFEIFYIKHADAYDVEYNLREYFKDELNDDSNSFGRRFFFGFGDESSSDPSLGQAPKLKFIWDPDTNSVLVQNASLAQLQVIRKLVDLYDQPIKEDDVAKRRTEAIPIIYSRATDIANALKEAYRDLLSSKDKEFQNREGNDGGRGRGQVYRFSFPGEDDDRSSPVKVQFEGALAIGVDEVSNTLIISAETNIWESVRMIVQQLDERANPRTTVALHEVSGLVNAQALREALQTAISQPWTGGRPPEGAGKSNAGGGENGGGDQRPPGERGDQGGGEGRGQRGGRGRD